MLFLDELPKFGATRLEGPRQPLGDRSVTLARAAGTLSFRLNFALVGAMTACRAVIMAILNDPVRAPQAP